jgi:cell division protein FtsW (lipid II flippase)
VYILAEHGALGGIVILLAYLLLTGAVGYLLMRSAGNNGPAMRAIRALFLVAVLIIVVPAVYVALSNIGVLPITGQNMPFLGLNAWSDVAICAGAVGMLVTSAIHNAEGAV